MKTLIPILLVLFLLVSCEKKKPCYYCETITYSKYDDRELKYSSEIVCDKSELEIIDYQLARFDFSDPASYTSCKCTKQ